RVPEQTALPPPGEEAARTRFDTFLNTGLDRYDADRNDPTLDGTSGMSPYLHFGQVSPVLLARKVLERGGAGAASFIEQLTVRRELSLNLVRFLPDAYDRWEGLPDWARRTLRDAAGDKRDYLYSRSDFEAARTHDPYWNAAQNQLVRSGSIHNYMRMYWGKKMLEWSADPREAYGTALYLNDRYALDGRDPNGYAGVAWCFGRHDRPWAGRAVFGTVRYMNAAGLRRKFDADVYAKAWA
ncbi:MAG TPA: deoxyribodipyrimidine photolyase, partial [Spirochaetales bacterium]|nr:deoxyribodipyrimidine photolyase [Spirochaetales bacterium]